MIATAKKSSSEALVINNLYIAVPLKMNTLYRVWDGLLFVVILSERCFRFSFENAWKKG